MRIDGEWYECDDGVVRPVIRGEILAANGLWEPALLLVDTGADRTALTAALLDVLGYRPTGKPEKLAGIGGLAEAVLITTRIQLPSRGSSSKTVLSGEYAAFTDLESLDICVLGRDILDLFAVIVDRSADVVSLVAQNHRYRIERR